MQIGVITNPNSRKNKGKRNRAAELQGVLGRSGIVHATDSVDDIKPILRDFLRRRARYWVADGGDGALHWMLRAGFEVLQEDEFSHHEMPVAVPTKGGTIDFVANNVGIKGRAEQILDKLRTSVERNQRIEEVEVDSMLIEGIQKGENGRFESFRTYGFASAAGGIGQRFYSKYYADEDPNPRTIVKVVGNTLASMPVALSPLRAIPGMPKVLRDYAREVFAPTECKVTVDGMILPGEQFTGVHIASMSINLGGVFKFFGKADTPGHMSAIVGALSPMGIVMNIPNMHLGRPIRGGGVLDRACREMTLEATGRELLSPIIDGEYYRDVRQITFKLGPRVRIPKVVANDATTH